MKDIIDNVSIKIQTGVYKAFQILPNKPWYALGEFVDNAIQSYENNKSIFEKLYEGNYTLQIIIRIDKENDIISIKDNAGGIGLDNYGRAFEPANIPTDNTGFNEHGMGMKTASIWLSNVWKVKTKAINENEIRFLEFNLNKVIDEKMENLKVVRTPEDKNKHFTEITLNNLSQNAPSKHQLDKIKRHLTSIYRNYIRSGSLELTVNDELLTFNDPEILNAPYYKDKDGKNILWKKNIDFSMGNYSAKGFIGILKTMSNNKVNGLSLFRRGRVIVGSHDEKYKPKELCGQIGSPRYKRIFGELSLKGFKVSYDKGSFLETGELEALIKGIKLEISSKDFDLYGQAQKYIKPKSKDHNLKVAKKLINELKKDISVNEKNDKPNYVVPDQGDIAQQNERLKTVKSIGSYEDNEKIKGVEYNLKQEFINDPSISTLYSLETLEDTGKKVRVVYKINLANEFFNHYDKFKKESDYKPIVAIIKSLVLSELVAPSQGTTGAGNIRLNFNNFLNNS